MHFIAEACYRRPLEPRALAYSRGGTAITMGFLFLGFCGYLIALIYNDKPLTQVSSEPIGNDIASPDVEICAQNSTLNIVKCSAMYYNWTVVDIPNCWQDYFRPGIPAPGDASRCYVFESKDRFRMATGLTFDSRNALRRLDFYWNVDNLQNLTYSTISIAAVAIQLYDPSFTTWRPETIGNSPVEQMMIDNIQLGISRATSYINYTSGIFYTPQKYRAVRPRDLSTILGLKSNYIDIITLANRQHTWPIQSNPPPPPPAVDKNLYQGYFSVQLSQGTIDIKTEIMQHTILASVALAGGCYGVLTTIYILLFGMTRLTPWGLVHHIPVFISKHRHHDLHHKKFAQEESMYHENEELDETNHTKKKGFSTSVLVPWFFRSRLKRSNESFTSADVKEAIMTKMIVRSKQESEHPTKSSRVDSTELHLLDKDKRYSSRIGLTSSIYDKQYNDIPLSPQLNKDPKILYNPPLLVSTPPSLPPHYAMQSNSSSSRDIGIPPVDTNIALIKEQEKSALWEARTTELSNRVEELEIILSEYFINTAYLDQLRVRRNNISQISQDNEVRRDN